MSRHVGNRRVLLGGVLPQPSFWAQFNDLGNGAVDTSLSLGSGALTFARATAAASRLASGTWKLDVASGTARSHYLADLSYGGYYVEDAATQLVVAGSVRDMTDANWVKVTMTTAKTSTGIDGTATSCTRLTAAGANATILQTLVAAASTRTYSCFMKRVTGTGTILIMQGATTLDVTALINSSTFTLVQLPASVLNSAYGIQINTNGDAIDVDCNQFEAGAIATSPIPAAGTRNADQLRYPNAGNFFGPSGAVFARVMCATYANTPRFVALSDSTDRPAIFASGGGTVIGMNDGTTTVNGPALATAGAIGRYASWWNGAMMQSFSNNSGGAVGAFDGDFDLGTNFGVGYAPTAASFALNGTIRDLRGWKNPLKPALIANIL